MQDVHLLGGGPLHVSTSMFLQQTDSGKQNESLSKQQLRLGIGQCTEMHVWPCAFKLGIPFTEKIFHFTGVYFV